MQCNTIRYNTVYCIAVYCCVVHCTAVPYSALHFTTLHYTAVYCSAVQCSEVQCSTVECSAVQCTAMGCAISLRIRMARYLWDNLRDNPLFCLSLWHLLSPSNVGLKRIVWFCPGLDNVMSWRRGAAGGAGDTKGDISWSITVSGQMSACVCLSEMAGPKFHSSLVLGGRPAINTALVVGTCSLSYWSHLFWQYDLDLSQELMITTLLTSGVPAPFVITKHK